MFKYIIAQNQRIMSMKKMAYCSICDAYKKAFINHEKKTIQLDKELCLNVLYDNMDYYKFMNIALVRFTQQLFNYAKCVDNDYKY